MDHVIVSSLEDSKEKEIAIEPTKTAGNSSPESIGKNRKATSSASSALAKHPPTLNASSPSNENNKRLVSTGTNGDCIDQNNADDLNQNGSKRRKLDNNYDDAKNPGEPQRGSTSAQRSDSNYLFQYVAQADEATRNRHKQILLNLFQHTDKKAVLTLATKTSGVDAPAHVVDSKRRQRHTTRGHATTNDGPSLFASLPVTLQTFEDLSRRRSGSSCISIVDDSKKRKGYSSRSLDELEELVNAKFLKSALYKKVCFPCESKTRLQKPQHDGITSVEQPEKVMSAFTFQYNECSIAAVALWAAKDEITEFSRERTSAEYSAPSTEYHIPTVPTTFRKCNVCGFYGHYEIECNNLEEHQILELAQQAKVQETVRGLALKNTDEEGLPFHHRSHAEEAKPAEDNETDDLDDDLSRRYLVCEVCRSGLDDDHMLICDGCDKLFHLFCLDPPLRDVPEGDWFCIECVRHNQGVDSDVEVEGCDGFVIEQRKRSRGDSYLRGDKGIGFPGDGWQTAIAVIGDETNAEHDAEESRQMKRRRHAAMPEEKIEIDGFAITAKSTSKSPHVSRRMKAWAMSADDVSKSPLVTGSVVAWFPSAEIEDRIDQGSDPLVGVILAIDSASGRALVRRIDAWKEILLDSWTERTTEAPQRLEDCAVQSISTGATVWICTEKLHLVGRAPPKGATETFQSKVLPARVAREQDKSARSAFAGVAQKPTLY